MFGQVDLGKGALPKQAQQLIITEKLSHSLSHTTVLSMRNGGNIRRIQERKMLTKARCMHIITYLCSCRINAPRSRFSSVRSENMIIMRSTRHSLFRVFVLTLLSSRERVYL